MPQSRLWPSDERPTVPAVRDCEAYDVARRSRWEYDFARSGEAVVVTPRHHYQDSGRIVALTNAEEHVMEFVWFILIGLVAGALAGWIMKGGGYGIVGDIVVGVLGALIGGSLFPQLGISAGGGLPGAVVVATIGAILLILILRLINRAGGRGLGL